MDSEVKLTEAEFFRVKDLVKEIARGKFTKSERRQLADKLANVVVGIKFAAGLKKSQEATD